MMERNKQRSMVLRVLILSLFLCMLSGITVFGDMIWTPNDPELFERDRDYDYVGRRYYANGPGGYVTVMEEPGSGQVLEYIGNGPVFYVSLSCPKGKEAWGIVQYRKDENGQPTEDYGWEEGAVIGWISMDELTAIYDGQSFLEDHESEIKYTDADSMPRISMPEQGAICLWSYPGAEVPFGQIEHLDENTIQFDMTYRDPEGSLWGHSSYYYGQRNFWVNTDSPGDTTGADIPVETPEIIPPLARNELERLPKTGRNSGQLILAAGGLIAFAMLLTSVIIYHMAKHKKP